MLLAKEPIISKNQNIFRSLPNIAIATLIGLSNVSSPAQADTNPILEQSTTASEQINLKLDNNLPSVPLILNITEINEKYFQYEPKIKEGKIVLPKEFLENLRKFNFNKPLSIEIDTATKRIILHNQVLHSEIGVVVYRRLLINMLSKIDTKILKTSANDKGEISLGEGINIQLVDNFPGMSLENLDFGNNKFQVLSSYSKEEKSFIPYCGGNLITDPKTKAQLVVIAEHCIKGEKDIYISDGIPTLDTPKLISDKAIRVTVTTDIILVFVPTKENIDLAIQTATEMYKAREEARAEEDPKGVVVTTMQQYYGRNQPTPFFLPISISNYGNIHNTPANRKAVGVNTDYSTKVSTNHTSGYAFVKGNSGSPTFGITSNGQAKFIGVASTSNNEYKQTYSTIFSSPKYLLRNKGHEYVKQTVAVMDYPELQAFINKLKSITPISSVSNSVADEVSVPLKQFEPVNIIEAVVSETVYDWEKLLDKYKYKNVIELLETYERVLINPSFEKITEDALVRMYIERLKKIPSDQRRSWFTSTIFPTAAKIAEKEEKNTKLSGFITGVIKRLKDACIELRN